jgi:5,5'-dehydrodivanillate O-demethylase
MHFSDDELRTTAGSAAHALLTLFWQPVCLSGDVANPGSKCRVSVFGATFIVARLLSGKLICMDEHCPHRGASLLYGFVCEHSIRCAYHGWKFDAEGHAIARPFELEDEHSGANTRAYPVDERYGLIFVYFGPPNIRPSPPAFDVLERHGFSVVSARHAPLNCNWLAIQENAADVTHTVFLHGEMNTVVNGTDSTGFSLPLLAYGFQPKPFGLIKTWKYQMLDGTIRFGYGNLLLLPNLLVIQAEVHWRVPVDDDHTLIFIASALPPDEAKMYPANREISFKDAKGKYDLSTPFGQDAMVLETAHQHGRDSEVLGQGDYGVSLFRKIMRNLLEKPSRQRIDSLVDNGLIALRPYMGGYLPSTGLFKDDASDSVDDGWEKIRDPEFREFMVRR